MRAFTTAVLFVFTACSGASSDAGSDARVDHGRESWSLSAEPVLSIGVVEGAEPYQLHSATSSLLLPDGRTVVVNGGSDEVRFFDGEGGYLGAFGQDGDGPGEFRNAVRVHLLDETTLRVWDSRLDRFSFHALDGAHQRVERLERDPAEPFAGDVWLYERHLIDSPITPNARGALVAGIEALPPVDSLIPVRYLRVTEQGRMWASDEALPADHPVDVSVYALDGTLVANVTVPPRFELHDIGPDYVLGRAFDELDVNSIQRYTLQKPQGSRQGPGLDAVRATTRTPIVYTKGVIPDDVRPTIVGMIRNLASRQEINYSETMSYTTDVELLEIQPPEGIRVDFLEATARGWTGLLTHTPTGAYCVLTYGFNVPMGWQPGRVICPALPRPAAIP